jgi:two-component system response regulator PilR (NtrC family)
MSPSAAAPRLLVVDDEPDLRTLYELTLMREGYHVDSAGTVEEAWRILLDEHFDLLITDMRLPDGTGLDLLSRLESAGRPETAIVITAYGSPENAVEALKAGAYDYLTKPVDLRQFRSVVGSALGRVPAAPESPSTEHQPAPVSSALARMSGDSAAMREVRALVQKVARSMAPVLVQGESGTGKELVARAIHEVSPRASGPFVAVNCGAIPEQLLEAEFFGYRKGAFTGAQEDRAGFFQAAHGWHPVPRRDRRLAAGHAKQAAAGRPGTRRAPCRRRGRIAGRHTADQRHAPGSDPRGTRRPFPAGPVLSPERDPHRRATAA